MYGKERKGEAKEMMTLEGRECGEGKEAIGGEGRGESEKEEGTAKDWCVEWRGEKSEKWRKGRKERQ